MFVSQDKKQYVKSTFKFLIEIYKIFVGTFLTLTVPKYCGTSSCTIIQNIQDTTMFHRIALYINLLNFCFFLCMYYIELKRERWCIKYLDIDLNKSIANLDTEIERYPKFKKEMRVMNKYYSLITKICVCNQVVNIAVSAVDIYYKYYGFRSLTPFSTYVLVILMKLYNSYYVSHESLVHERAYSAFLSDPTNYNSIDKDYI